jgi:phthalate 4,5-cis-dihydrodiol dehydrogenase
MSKVPGVRLTCAADIRPEARNAFARDYGLPALETIEALCESAVDAVWIETPNHLHCEHVLAAAARGKHVILRQPLAATLDECDRMITACRANGVRLLQGHSKIFDSPIRAMADIARSGRLGRVIAIDGWWFNDWLRRPPAWRGRIGPKPRRRISSCGRRHIWWTSRALLPARVRCGCER